MNEAKNISDMLGSTRQTNQGHSMYWKQVTNLQFASTKVVAKIDNFWQRIITETIEICIGNYQVNWELGGSWSPALWLLDQGNERGKLVSS